MRDVSAAATTLPGRGLASARVPSFAETAERHLDDVYRAEKRRRSRERAASDAMREVAPPDLGLSPALERALAALSAADREVVALRIVLDLDAEAAARLLGISVTACTTRLSRALKRLEELMSDDE